MLIGIILAVLTGIPLGVTAVPEGIISGLDFHRSELLSRSMPMVLWVL